MSPATAEKEGVTIQRGFDVPAADLAAKIAVVLGVISEGRTHHVDRLCTGRRRKSTFKEALRPVPGWGPYLMFA